MKNLIILVLITATSVFQSMAQSKGLKGVVNSATNVVNNVTGSSGTSSLSNDEVVKGLKEALTIGTNNSSASASKLDGYLKNPMIAIPFPPEALAVKRTAENFGMKPQVDRFVTTLNRAAEEAAKEAAPIFVGAVKTMTITDGFTILKGGDNAATTYLEGRTTPELQEKFKPVVQRALNKVEITKYWSPLINQYNRVPFVQKMNPNLEDYVTKKAIEGMFKLIAQEEMKIRKDPMARVNDILKRVFGGG